MTQHSDTFYEADEGKMFVRVSDGFVMGDGIDLGVDDSIENYEERAFTPEERAAFWASIGMEDPKARSVSPGSPAEEGAEA